MRNLDDVFTGLARSRFRQRFRLQARELASLTAHGLAGVLEHGRGFITRRLAPADPLRDGRQTPYRGHPIFVAQHATATCCRGCLEKWHGIPKGRPLSDDEQQHVMAALERWLREQIAAQRAARRGAAS